MMLENLGNVYRLKGDTKRARSYLEEACRIAQQEKGEDSLEAAKVLVHLAKIYTLLADYKVAMKKIKLALKITDSIKLILYHRQRGCKYTPAFICDVQQHDIDRRNVCCKLKLIT